MTLRNIISENIILPFGDYLTDQSVSKWLKFLMKSQWWSKEELINYQEGKLKELIQHAVESVPYYRNYFKSNGLRVEDIKTIDDLSLLPVISKKTVIEEGIENFLSETFPVNKRVKKKSSGSTGAPFTYYTSKEAYSVNIAANLRGWYGMGYRLGDKFIKISNTPRNKIKEIQDTLSNNKCIYVGKYTKENIDKVVETILKHDPKILRSYVTPLFLIYKEFKKREINIKNLKAITTTGSVLYTEFRKELQEYFECEVFDSYSCEGGANVFECHTHECYHSTMEYAITELLDTNNNKTSYGRVITTDLWNYAMPFIRYDTQDYFEIDNSKCTCGRHLMTIKKILGRDTDLLVGMKNELITPHSVSIFMSKMNNIEEYQIRQEEINNFKIFFKVKKGYDKVENEEIIKYMESTFGKGINIDIIIVDDIPLTESGKRRYIMRSNKIGI